MRKSYFLLLFAAMFTLFSCNNEKQPNNPPLSEEDKIVNELMAQCQDFDAEDIMQGLPGEWKYDSQLLYDKSWKNILETYIFFGRYYIYAGGSSAPKFSFTADGKGKYHFTYPYPPYEEDFLSFDWNFDATDNKLVLSGGYDKSAVVSGFNNVYLILDYVNNKNQNIREILKKGVE